MAITITGKITQTGKAMMRSTLPPLTAPGQTGIFFGGYISGGLPASQNVIEWITIDTLGAASVYGELIGPGGAGQAGGSNGTTALMIHSSIQQTTISTAGNATSFGSLLTSHANPMCVSNGINDRGVLCAGTNTNTLEYVTISTPGNAESFGYMTDGKWGETTGTSNDDDDRGIWGAGNISGNDMTTDKTGYITISTLGNSLSGGTLTVGRRASFGGSNGTGDKALFMGGWIDGAGTPLQNVIDRITISTASSSVDYADLVPGRTWAGVTSNGTDNRIVIGSGGADNGYTLSIDYTSAVVKANTTDFGVLTVARRGLDGVSNSPVL